VVAVSLQLDSPAWFDLSRCKQGVRNVIQDHTAICPLDITIFTQKPLVEVCTSFTVRGEAAWCKGDTSATSVTLSFPFGIRQPTTVTLPSSERIGANWQHIFVHADGVLRSCTNSSQLVARCDMNPYYLLQLKTYPDIMRGLPLDVDAIALMHIVCQVCVRCSYVQFTIHWVALLSFQR